MLQYQTVENYFKVLFTTSEGLSAVWVLPMIGKCLFFGGIFYEIRDALVYEFSII